MKKGKQNKRRLTTTKSSQLPFLILNAIDENHFYWDLSIYCYFNYRVIHFNTNNSQRLLTSDFIGYR